MPALARGSGFWLESNMPGPVDPNPDTCHSCDGKADGYWETFAVGTDQWAWRYGQGALFEPERIPAWHRANPLPGDKYVAESDMADAE